MTPGFAQALDALTLHLEEPRWLHEASQSFFRALVVLNWLYDREEEGGSYAAVTDYLTRVKGWQTSQAAQLAYTWVVVRALRAMQASDHEC